MLHSLIATVLMLHFLAFPVIFTIFVVYFLPTIIAVLRGHPSSLAIFVLNLFLGGTFIGWVLALVWACADNQRPIP